MAHFDLYRLTAPEEAFEIGLDEALDVGAALIEWPERLGDDLDRMVGPHRLVLEISEAGEGRVAVLTGHGNWETKVTHVRP